MAAPQELHVILADADEAVRAAEQDLTTALQRTKTADVVDGVLAVLDAFAATPSSMEDASRRAMAKSAKARGQLAALADLAGNARSALEDLHWTFLRIREGNISLSEERSARRESVDEFRKALRELAEGITQVKDLPHGQVDARRQRRELRANIHASGKSAA